MADKIKYDDLFDASISKQIKELSKQLEGLNKKMSDLKKTGAIDYSNSGKSLKKLTDEQKKSKKETQKLNALDRERLKVQKQLETAKAQLKVSQDSEFKRLQRLKEEKRAQIKLSGAEVGSIQRLRDENRKLTKQRNSVSTATEKGRKKIQELNKMLDKNNKIIKENSDQLSKQKQNVGNYKDDVKAAVTELGGLPGPLGQAQRGFKALNTVVKLNPLGLLLTAITTIVGALGSFFTQTQRGREIFDRFKATVGAAVDVLVDRFSAFGETIYKAFSNPKQAIAELWLALKTNIVNRVEALIDTFGAFGRVIKAVFERDLEGLKKAAGEAKTSLIQLSTGLDEEQQQKVADGFKKIAEDIKEESEAANQLEKRLQDLERREIGFIVTREKMRAEIAENRKAIEDETLSYQDRMDALEGAINTQRRLAEEEKAIASERVAILEQQIALGESTNDDYRELEELKANLFRIEQQEDKLLKTLFARRKSLNNEMERANNATDENTNAVDRNAEKLKELETLLNDVDMSLIDPETEQQQLNKALEKLKEFGDKYIEQIEEIEQRKQELQTESRIAEAEKQAETFEGLAEQAGQLNDTIQGFTDARVMNLEAQKAQELKLAGDNAEKRAQIEAKYNERIKQERKKTAELEMALNVAQILSSAAAGAIRLWVQPGFPANIPLLALLAAQTGVQLAQANAQKNKIQALEKGGELKGPRHSEGGIPVSVNGDYLYEAEGGEFVVNRKAMAENGDLVKAINDGVVDKRMLFGNSFRGKSINYKKDIGRIAEGQDRMIDLLSRQQYESNSDGKRYVRSLNGNTRVYV